MSTGIARLGRCDVGNRNINGGLLDIKINSQIRDALFFSHLVPFITAHGFIDLKFIQKLF
jgi:hypothetical protein